MGVVALKPLPIPPSPDGYLYFDEIKFSPGSPPDRPHPQPPNPGGPGIPTFPIWGPPGFGPGHGFPDRPGYPEIPGLPGGGGGGEGAKGIATPWPPSLPEPPMPAEMPPGSKPILVFYPGEKYPAVGFVGPYPSSGPVPVPPAPA